jgi:peptidoglycan/LPS O-acetylase OafA/YrhL
MKLYLISTQVLYALSLVPWLMIWGLSFMSFDSGFHVYNVSFVLAITLYPVAVLVGSVLAWLFRNKKKKFAIIINLLPFVWIISFAVFILINN